MQCIHSSTTQICKYEKTVQTDLFILMTKQIYFTRINFADFGKMCKIQLYFRWKRFI